MKAAPSSCRVSTKRISRRPYISVTMVLVVEPTTPKVYSTPSARSASITARPAFIVRMVSHNGGYRSQRALYSVHHAPDQRGLPEPARLLSLRGDPEATSGVRQGAAGRSRDR